MQALSAREHPRHYLASGALARLTLTRAIPRPVQRLVRENTLTQ